MSVGFYPNTLPLLTFTLDAFDCTFSLQLAKRYHIDTNCYAMTRETALRIAPHWYSGEQNDTQVFEALRNLGLKAACTCQFSVNYTFSPHKYNPDLTQLLQVKGVSEEGILTAHYQVLAQFQEYQYELNGNKLPWEIKG